MMGEKPGGKSRRLTWLVGVDAGIGVTLGVGGRDYHLQLCQLRGVGTPAFVQSLPFRAAKHVFIVAAEVNRGGETESARPETPCLKRQQQQQQLKKGGPNWGGRLTACRRPVGGRSSRRRWTLCRQRFESWGPSAWAQPARAALSAAGARVSRSGRAAPRAPARRRPCCRDGGAAGPSRSPGPPATAGKARWASCLWARHGKKRGSHETGPNGEHLKGERSGEAGLQWRKQLTYIFFKGVIHRGTPSCLGTVDASLYGSSLPVACC